LALIGEVAANLRRPPKKINTTTEKVPARSGNSRRAEIPATRSRNPMSNITTLAEGQLTAVGTITIELVEADETSAVVIIRWPHKPCIIHPRRFPAAADNAARIIAAAAVCCGQSSGAPAVIAAAFACSTMLKRMGRFGPRLAPGAV
jgi:hypothetical protein